MMDDDGYFGADIASSYDRIHNSDGLEVERSIAKVLHELAFDGTALEFAIGTGRIAVSLHELGVSVKGIELSKAMAAQLQKKDHGASIDVTIGDMTNTFLDEEFSLVFLIYNTIDNLTSQDAQLACFKNAALHLKAGGRFVIETLVPPIQKIPFGETMLAYDRSDQHWGTDEFDVTTQNYTSHHLRLENGAYRELSIPFRYAWPSELDLMAKFAGLELESRWADWGKSDFTNISSRHVSVWRKTEI